MKSKKLRIISPADFQREFMPEQPKGKLILNAPVQVYDIQSTSGFIKIPTPLHRPDYNFVVHITGGVARQQVEAEVISLYKHNVLFVKQGNITSLQEVNRNVTGKIVLFEDSMLNHILSRRELIQLFSANPLFTLSTTTSDWLATLFDLIASEKNADQPDMPVCYSLLQAALLKIISSGATAVGAVSRGNQVTYQFKALVYQHHIQQKSVSYYANALSVTVNYLNRCVKATTGLPPKEWINKASMVQGQLLLQDLTKDIRRSGL